MTVDELKKVHADLLLVIEKSNRNEDTERANRDTEMAMYHRGYADGVARFADWISSEIKESERGR